MKYNRKQRSSNPIDILKFETVETGAIFKQYDVNTSILEIALVANGEPVRIDNSFKIYATVKPHQRSSYDVLYRYSENYKEDETSNYKILLNAEKMKARSSNNMINLYLSPLALSFSGDMVAELILVDLENQQRVTSQEFTFKIEPSLTPNQKEDIAYTVVEDLDGTYITDSEELKLLAIDGVSGFKLSFTGLEVNEILQSVQGLNHEENNRILEALNQKDEEMKESIDTATKERKKINSEITLLKNKDLALDSEIESLKEYDEANTSSINEVKEDIVNLKLYTSSNDTNIRNINSNIENFKQYNASNTQIVNGIKEDLQNYKSSNSQVINSINENLENYKTENNENISTINNDISLLKDYNSKNDSKIEEFNRNITDNANSISRNLEKINSNTSLIERNKENISAINLKNEEIERELTPIKENIENSKNDILNIGEEVKKNTEDIKLIKENSNSSDSNKEVIDARTATTGEQFDSLDERIDHEVDRINKKIEVSMLQQEDAESHTVENTVEGLTTDMIIKGRTLQNLFNQEGYYINPNGTQQYFHSRKYKNFFKAGKYTLKNVTGEALIWDISRISDDTWIKSIKANKSVVIDLQEGQYVRNIQALTENGWNLDENTKELLKNNVIVLEGDKLNIIDTVEYFEGIKSFGEQEDKISILSSSKNLFDKSQYSDYFKDDMLEFKADGNSRVNNFFYIYTEKNSGSKIIFNGYDSVGRAFTTINQKKYYILLGLNGDKQDNKVWGEIILPKNTTCYYSAVNEKGDNFVKFKDIQIEIGTSKTHYEEYKEDKKDILIKEPLREGDCLYEDNGQVKVYRKSNKTILTGDDSERWALGKTSGGWTEFDDSLIFYSLAFENKMSANSNIICNRFKYNSNVSKNEISIYNNAWKGLAHPCIRVPKSVLSSQDVDGFKAWLKANPTTIVYQLDTPTVEVVDGVIDINLKTFGERTYVLFENSISGTSSFKAPVNTVATIARLNRENRALEEENKNLKQDFKSTTLTLIDSDLELVKQNVDMDFRLMEVEFALDIPQAILSSNINFKNKKGEVKSMARSPYEMMKIVILSGDYDREDYIHKVGKYYERGRMTKEEHDELMSLMTADEVISKKN